MIATAQPSGIQKRLASTNEEKKHHNVHDVALAANGAPKNSLLYQEKKIQRKDEERCSWEKSRQLNSKQHARSFISQINGWHKTKQNAHAIQLQHILAKQCTWKMQLGGHARALRQQPASAFRACARESCFPARIIFFCLTGASSFLPDALICF